MRRQCCDSMHSILGARFTVPIVLTKEIGQICGGCCCLCCTAIFFQARLFVDVHHGRLVVNDAAAHQVNGHCAFLSLFVLFPAQVVFTGTHSVPLLPREPPGGCAPGGSIKHKPRLYVLGVEQPSDVRPPSQPLINASLPFGRAQFLYLPWYNTAYPRSIYSIDCAALGVPQTVSWCTISLWHSLVAFRVEVVGLVVNHATALRRVAVVLQQPFPSTGLSGVVSRIKKKGRTVTTKLHMERRRHRHVLGGGCRM